MSLGKIARLLSRLFFVLVQSVTLTRGLERCATIVPVALALSDAVEF